ALPPLDPLAALPPAPRLADRSRLARHARRGCRHRARARGRGGEALPDPVLVDGADSALRRTCLRLPRAVAGPGGGGQDRVPVPEPGPGGHRRLPGAGGCAGALPRRRRVRQAHRRPAGRDGVRARRGRVRRRPAPARAVRRPGPARPPHADVAAGACARLLRHGRQPGCLLRLARLGAGAAQGPDRAGRRQVLAAQPPRLPVAGTRTPPHGPRRRPARSAVASPKTAGSARSGSFDVPPAAIAARVPTSISAVMSERPTTTLRGGRPGSASGSEVTIPSFHGGGVSEAPAAGGAGSVVRYAP